MVLGEPQILGQLKDAYQQARQAKGLGGELERLFQHTFAVAKQVRTETGIGKNPVSVAYAAVSMASRIFDDFTDAVSPRRLRVELDVAVRGGIHTTAVKESD